MNWPIADLDEVRRLRVLHAALPGTALAETVVPAAFDTVWPELSDLEGSFLDYAPGITTIRLSDRHGDRMRAHVRDRLGLRAPFDVVLRPGWCVMQSRFVVFGMAAAPAATPAGAGTRIGYLIGLRLPLVRRPLAACAAPLARALLRRAHRRWLATH